MEGRQIHEDIYVAHEGLYSQKPKGIKVAVLKIDLSMAFDRVSWLYLRMLVTHLGFEYAFIKWILLCITSASQLQQILELASHLGSLFSVICFTLSGQTRS